MTSRSLHYVQEAGEDEQKLDFASKCKRLTNCIKKNRMIGQIDFFSLDVRFMIKGEETFKTLFSGFVGLSTMVILAFITYLIAWPDTFISTIVQTSYTSKASPSNLSLFSYVQEPVSLQVRPIDPNNQLPSQLQVNFYYVRTGKDPQKLEYDTNCKYGKFCLTKNVNKGKNLQIFGGKNAGESGHITIQVFWCPNYGVSCFMPEGYQFIITFQNTKKEREKKLIPYTVSNRMQDQFGYMDKYIYTFPVTREKYTSNNKILGHISNLLPESFQTYYVDRTCETQIVNTESHLIGLRPSKKSLFQVNLKYSNKRSDINERFINIITPILFFFSVLDPFKWLLNQFILKRYNMNCRNLYIANKIYYVEDLQNYEKYNFGGGIVVFFVCLVHKHILMRLFGWIIGLFGKNFVDILPQKCIHTMNMIDKGASLMCQNVFFGSLQELSTLEDCPGKKMPFNQSDAQELQQQQDQPEANYYSDNPIRRAAFIKFCRDNEYITGKRKNKVYQILLDNKFTTFLKDGMHKQFETYVRNIQNLKISGKFQNTLRDMDIPVEVVESNGRGDQTQSNMKFGKIRPA